MKFEILINEAFDIINLDSDIRPVSNKKVLSLVNDFEEGSWRFEKFQNFIWNHIKETALSHRERSALSIEGEDSILTAAARKLRLVEEIDAVGRGSEIGEIVLYGLMKLHYKALPIVPKIFYKQNNNDEAKGADSVHIILEPDGKFSLWLGESKFYSSIEDARLDKIVTSVKNSISFEKIKKENSIITNLNDINEFSEISDEIKANIFTTLSQFNSTDDVKAILNIPILLLYDCNITKSETIMSAAYKDKIIEYHKDRATKYFKKQVNTCKDIHMYDKIQFHIILFPVADKEKIVNKFITKAKIYRDDYK